MLTVQRPASHMFKDRITSSAVLRFKDSFRQILYRNWKRAGLFVPRRCRRRWWCSFVACGQAVKDPTWIKAPPSVLWRLVVLGTTVTYDNLQKFTKQQPPHTTRMTLGFPLHTNTFSSTTAGMACRVIPVPTTTQRHTHVKFFLLLHVLRVILFKNIALSL